MNTLATLHTTRIFSSSRPQPQTRLRFRLDHIHFTTMATFTNLPAEMLLEVASYLPNHNLLFLACVNKEVSPIALEKLHQHPAITKPNNGERLMSFTRALLADTKWLGCVKNLSVAIVGRTIPFHDGGSWDEAHECSNNLWAKIKRPELEAWKVRREKFEETGDDTCYDQRGVEVGGREVARAPRSIQTGVDDHDKGNEITASHEPLPTWLKEYCATRKALLQQLQACHATLVKGYKTFLNHLLYWDQYAFYAAIIALIPNVESLTLSFYSMCLGHYKYIDDNVQHVGQRLFWQSGDDEPDHKTVVGGLNVLSKLQHFELDNTPISDNWLQLPSLRSLKLGLLRNIQYLHQPIPVNITRLYI